MDFVVACDDGEVDAVVGDDVLGVELEAVVAGLKHSAINSDH